MRLNEKVERELGAMSLNNGDYIAATVDFMENVTTYIIIVRSYDAQDQYLVEHCSIGYKSDDEDLVGFVNYAEGYQLHDDFIEIRPATVEEREFADNALNEDGVYFNREIKQIEEL